ncbi:hypothetical protein [Brasilonema bromeliae]|uniref:hypothetical protein n=1 Tax=Brasilonema bromeliae TaxID=383615 RepID=UPI00145E20DB|nr:hypothetical protein [Brasilonema bromeliae]
MTKYIMFVETLHVSPALREGFQRQIPMEGNPPAVLAPPQATGESEGQRLYTCEVFQNNP